jgi:NTE family protein
MSAVSQGPRGIVLSGGAARGAYEAGVISVLLERLAQRPRSFRAVCGTSVGAIHAAFFCAGLADPLAASRTLEQAWATLVLDEVVRFGWREVRGLRRLVWGGREAASILDVRPLLRLVDRTFEPAGVAEALASGRADALLVTATHVPTGRPVVFAQRGPRVELPTHLSERVRVRETLIQEQHVVASAAIPLLLRPQRIEGEFYCDGGLRLNTPLEPAVRLGVTRVLVVALSSVLDDLEPPELEPERYPSASFLLGKVMNAFFLDHVLQDIEDLERVNQVLDDVEAIEPGFGTRMAERAAAQGRPPFQRVEPLVIRPSVNLGAMAADFLRERRSWFRGLSATGLLQRLLDTGERGSDLASYLLFDGEFCRRLFVLGRQDARAQLDKIEAFLSD